MGRIGVIYEDIANAATQLQGEGKHPTVDNIRSILQTGSKSTIARHLKNWKQQKGIERASDGAIPSELLSLVKGLWERLQSSVEEQANEYRCEADSKVVHANQALQNVHQQNTALQEKLHQLEERLHLQIEENKTLQSTLIKEQKEKAKADERLAALASHNEAQQKETERLHQLLKHVQTNLEHYQTATQKLREEQSLKLDKQRNEFELKLNDLQKQLSKLATEKSQYQTQYDNLNKTHQQLQTEQEKKSESLEKLQEQHQQLSFAYQALEKQYRKFTEKYHQQTDLFKTKELALTKAQIKLNISNEKIESLEKALSKAENKIESLRQDVDFVSHEKANLEGQLKQLQTTLSKNQTEMA